MRAARQGSGQYRRLTYAHEDAAGVTRQGAPGPVLTTATNGPKRNGHDGQHAPPQCTIHTTRRHNKRQQETPARHSPAAAYGAKGPIVHPPRQDHNVVHEFLNLWVALRPGPVSAGHA
jgi:hypothetical protein